MLPSIGKKSAAGRSPNQSVKKQCGRPSLRVRQPKSNGKKNSTAVRPLIGARTTAWQILLRSYHNSAMRTHKKDKITSTRTHKKFTEHHRYRIKKNNAQHLRCLARTPSVRPCCTQGSVFCFVLVVLFYFFRPSENISMPMPVNEPEYISKREYC